MRMNGIDEHLADALVKGTAHQRRVPQTREYLQNQSVQRTRTRTGRAATRPRQTAPPGSRRCLTCTTSPRRVRSDRATAAAPSCYATVKRTMRYPKSSFDMGKGLDGGALLVRMLKG